MHSREYHNVLALCVAHFNSPLQSLFRNSNLADLIRGCIVFFKEHHLTHESYTAICATLESLMAVVVDAGL